MSQYDKYDKLCPVYNAVSLTMSLTVSKLRSESTAREFISLSSLFMSRRNFVLHSVIQIVTTVNDTVMFSMKEIKYSAEACIKMYSCTTHHKCVTFKKTPMLNRTVH